MKPVATGKKIFGLDVLRTMAILLVFSWHYKRYGIPGWLSGISDFGWTGVDLFFVLSGYLIGSQLFKPIAEEQSISVSAFYLKRFFRIVPAYAVVLLLYFLIPAFPEKEGMAPLWKFLTFTMNFGLDFQNAGAFSHAWSLCIEEQFYLLFPIIVILLSKLKAGNKIILVIAALFIFGFIIRIYSWNTFVAPLYADQNKPDLIPNIYSKYIYYPTYNRLDGLLTGILIALLVTFKPTIREKINANGNVLFLSGIIILVATYFLCNTPFTLSSAVFSYPLVSVGYGFLVTGSLSPACFINRFSLKIFSIIATLSYSIYLTHKQLIHIVQGFIADYHLNSTVCFFICFVVAILGGIALHYSIEQPFLKLRDKLLKEK
ncbi:MAG: Acyltransferase [Bacteroidetes bacterium]|nr:Acyltransferase [Bacteroidota bacterium]